MTTTKEDTGAIRAELHRCEQVQSWAFGATRSSWTHELRAILDATTDEERAEAVAEALAEQARLTTKVAEAIAVDVEGLRKRLDEDEDGDDDVWLLPDSVEALVDLARQRDVTIHDDSQGHRDGWILTADRAETFASCRTWVEGDCHGITVDALTGEVSTW